MKGRFYQLTRDLDGHLVVSFRVFDERNARREIEGIKDQETIDISAKTLKRKRSLSANAYYWILVGKLAGVMHISNSHCHNLLLRRYGAIQTIDGERVVCFLPDTDEAYNGALEAEKYHVKPTSAVKVFKDGNPRRMYLMLKGSSEYDSGEMSRLINGVVDECKQVGIETLTPREIEQMLEEVRKREKKYHP